MLVFGIQADVYPKKKTSTLKDIEDIIVECSQLQSLKNYQMNIMLGKKMKDRGDCCIKGLGGLDVLTLRPNYGTWNI